ncbi:hypothetical protein EKPV-NSW-ORF096 [Eastern grey kangaroopox virus]|uniref:Uncharacterized protein n=1 Tax=Eastern grey kangaroopox virus TaxID=2042482 RepID=A0A345Z0Q5_9POXV|nr:hypothetical protein EKPV-NSW-ORF096 [Eastern grey kangaroopox virus]
MSMIRSPYPRARTITFISAIRVIQETDRMVYFFTFPFFLPLRSRPAWTLYFPCALWTCAPRVFFPCVTTSPS